MAWQHCRARLFFFSSFFLLPPFLLGVGRVGAFSSSFLLQAGLPSAVFSLPFQESRRGVGRGGGVGCHLEHCEEGGHDGVEVGGGGPAGEVEVATEELP